MDQSTDSIKSTIMNLNRNLLNQMSNENKALLLEQMRNYVVEKGIELGFSWDRPPACSLNDLERLVYLNELDKTKIRTWMWQCIDYVKDKELKNLAIFVDALYYDDLMDPACGMCRDYDCVGDGHCQPTAEEEEELGRTKG